MLCENCKGRMVLNAFCVSNCEECGKEINNSSMPGDKLCKECAEKLDKCHHCGKELE